MLKRKGIKNYNFFLKLYDEDLLKLYDEDLVGVDPYDEHLTQEYKLKIILECRRNFWYFIREIMRIPPREIMRIPAKEWYLNGNKKI